jgi:hypothetical protein
MNLLRVILLHFLLFHDLGLVHFLRTKLVRLVDFSLRAEAICPFAFWDLGKVALFSSVQDNFQEHFFVDDGITLQKSQHLVELHCKNHSIWETNLEEYQ